MLARLASFLIVLPLAMSAACTDPPPTSPSTTCGDVRYFAIDRVDVPDLSGEVTSLGLDLDGDHQVDNTMGYAIELVRLANPDVGALDPSVTARLTTMPEPWLIGLSDCEDGTTHVELTQSGGSDVAPVSALVDPLGTYASIAWVRVERVTTRLTEHGDEVDGVIGFALRMPDAAPALAAPFAAYLTSELRAGTSPFAIKTDTDHDGVVTADEVLASDFGKVYLAPDLALDHAGKLDGLSCGLGVHATRVIE